MLFEFLHPTKSFDVLVLSAELSASCLLNNLVHLHVDLQQKIEVVKLSTNFLVEVLTAGYLLPNHLLLLGQHKRVELVDVSVELLFEFEY